MQEFTVPQKVSVILLLACMICTAPLTAVNAEPVFRYVEFNGERKWPGQTHIVEHGIMLQVIASLEQPQKQSMTADLILIDENGDARIERMERINTDVNKEWHAHDLDTSTLNSGSYTVRIRAWNAAREEEGGEKAIKSEEVTWGDLHLILETRQATNSSSEVGEIVFGETLVNGMTVALFLAVSAIIPVVILRFTRKPSIG